MSQPKAARGFGAFADAWGGNARLARDTLDFKATSGIPHKFIHVMDHGFLEEVSGHSPGDYRRRPEEVYRDFQLAHGACSVDQWIPRNPLTMSEAGYDSGTERGATTGAREIVVDEMVIDSPEAVVDHLERFVFPRQEKELARPQDDADARVREIILKEVETQEFLGTDILKIPYGGRFGSFPCLLYGRYGYECYFTAYALYPEVIERSFRLQADLAAGRNALAARAIVEGGLPGLVRLDHDMADSRGTLVAPETLDRMWFPHLARAIGPLLRAGVRLIWHCDGNLMAMVPRLIEAGVSGFQGFQYEDGMDYEKICSMTDRDGGPLMIWAGVSVTTTLPSGTKDDVVKELAWLVEKGPRAGLFLGASSSVAPGTNRENVRTLIEGLQYYERRGRAR